MVKNVFSPGTVAKSSEVNENFEYVEGLAAKGMAQVPYTTLKAVGDWENEGYLAADRFTAADGVNNTRLSGNTLFNTDRHTCKIGGDVVIENHDTSDAGSSTASNWSTTITYQGNRKGYINRIRLYGPDSGTFRQGTITISKNGVQIASGSYLFVTNSGDRSQAITFPPPTNIEDYFENGDTVLISVTSTGSLLIRTASFSGDLFSFSSQTVSRMRIASQETNWLEFTEIDGHQDSEIILQTLDITNRQNVSLYNKFNSPEGTSITTVLSDGTLETDEIEIENDTTTIITLPSGVEGQLQIKYLLKTTDVSITPELFGYGVYLQ